jgi:phosphocarrier protein HPr
VTLDGTQVSGKSIMGLLTLAAPRRASLLVTCDGDDAEPAMEALAAIIDARFGER